MPQVLCFGAVSSHKGIRGMTEVLNIHLGNLCEISMPRHSIPRARKLVHWWPSEIATLCEASAAARRSY